MKFALKVAWNSFDPFENVSDIEYQWTMGRNEIPAEIRGWMDYSVQRLPSYLPSKTMETNIHETIFSTVLYACETYYFEWRA